MSIFTATHDVEECADSVYILFIQLKEECNNVILLRWELKETLVSASCQGKASQNTAQP